MKFQRRSFLALLAGFAGTVLSVVRALAWPSWPESDDDAGPTGQASATVAEDASGIRFTTICRGTFRDSAGDLGGDPDIFYVQGDRRRWESARAVHGLTKPDGSIEKIYGPRTVTIVRPDLGKMFVLYVNTSEYTEMPYPPVLHPLTKGQTEARGIKIPPPGESPKPTFQIQITTRDTGERKEMFGYTARHVIITRREIPLEGTHRGAQEVVRDGWYIDLEPRLYPTIYPERLAYLKSRGPVHVYGSLRAWNPGKPSEPVEPPDVPEFIDIGEPENGFPVEELQTSRMSSAMPDGSIRQSEGTFETLVTLEKSNFDPALFEVPRGYRRM